MNVAELTREAPPVAGLSLADRQKYLFLVQEFNARYAEALDAGEIEAWPAFFTQDGRYKLVARDNAEADLPLSLMFCDGMGMLKDRAYAIEYTEMFAPRYTLHMISNTRILGLDGDELRARANYVIYETLIDEPTNILQVGTYNDRFRVSGEQLLLRERMAVYDTLMVPTCMVFPP